MLEKLSRARWIIWGIISTTLILVAAFYPLRVTWDEGHFTRTSLKFWHGPGSLHERFFEYESLHGPLEFLVVGWAAGNDERGLKRTRVLNAILGSAALGTAMKLGEALAPIGPIPGALVVGIALLADPYFTFVSTHFYTDTSALLALLACLLFWYRQKYLTAGLCLAASVAGRQFLAFLWLAYAAIEFFGFKKENLWKKTIPLLLPTVISAGLLILAWGGLAPKNQFRMEIARDSSFFPRLSYANYYIACIGAYLGWILVFRSKLRDLLYPVFISIAVSPLFFWAQPFARVSFINDVDRFHLRMGALDGVIRLIVGEKTLGWSLLMGACWCVGIILIIQFVRAWRSPPWGKLASWALLSFLVLHSVTDRIWEKYFLHLHVLLLLSFLPKMGQGSIEWPYGKSVSSGS